MTVLTVLTLEYDVPIRTALVISSDRTAWYGRIHRLEDSWHQQNWADMMEARQKVLTGTFTYKEMKLPNKKYNQCEQLKEWLKEIDEEREHSRKIIEETNQIVSTTE